MELVYFDSSAFVKLVVVEDGSDLAEALRDGASEVASSEIAYVEVRAALAAALRGRRLDRSAFSRAKRRWEELWDATMWIAPTTELLVHAGDLAERHSLRGSDAIHLATALALADDLPVVASWDSRLTLGAREAGLDVVAIG